MLPTFDIATPLSGQCLSAHLDIGASWHDQPWNMVTMGKARADARRGLGSWPQTLFPYKVDPGSIFWSGTHERHDN